MIISEHYRKLRNTDSSTPEAWYLKLSSFDIKKSYVYFKWNKILFANRLCYEISCTVSLVRILYMSQKCSAMHYSAIVSHKFPFNAVCLRYIIDIVP